MIIFHLNNNIYPNIKHLNCQTLPFFLFYVSSSRPQLHSQITWGFLKILFLRSSIRYFWCNFREGSRQPGLRPTSLYAKREDSKHLPVVSWYTNTSLGLLSRESLRWVFCPQVPHTSFSLYKNLHHLYLPLGLGLGLGLFTPSNHYTAGVFVSLHPCEVWLWTIVHLCRMCRKTQGLFLIF